MTSINYAAAVSALTGKSVDVLFGANPLVVLKQDAASNLSIASWDASLGPQPTIAALEAALTGAPTRDSLLAYAENKRAAIAAGGLSVNVAAAGATPLLVEVDTDVSGLALLSNAAQLAVSRPDETYHWDQTDPVTLSAAQILALQTAVGLFIQQTFAVKTAIRAAIGSGAVNAFAQIDDPTTVALSAWPQNA